MNFKLKLCAFTIVHFLVLNCLAVNVLAYEPPQPFCDYGFKTKDGVLISSKYMDVWEEKIFDEDFTVKKSHNLRIETIGNSSDATGGKVVVTNGATIELKGNLFIERGAILEIENGTVNIHGGNLQNCGTIIVRKNGRLHFQNGQLCSTAAGTIINDGKITCMNTVKNLNDIFKCIKKYDKNFNISDYALSIVGRSGNNADVILNYCIDDIKTDYTYKFTMDVNKEKTKIKRKSYSLETVYSANTQKRILDRTSEFERSYKGDLNFCNGFWKDYGYTFNYKSGEMTYEETWFAYDDINDIIYEKTHSEKF